MNLLLLWFNDWICIIIAGNQKDKNPKSEDPVDEDEIGGLFRVVSENQENIIKSKANKDNIDSSKYVITHLNDWSLPEVGVLIFYIYKKF